MIPLTVYYRRRAQSSHNSFPPCRFVAFLPKAPFNKLLIRWLRRFGLEQSLNKRLHETCDHTAYGTCCGALAGLPDNCTTRATCSGAHNTTACGASDHISCGTVSTLRRCRLGPFHTIVHIPFCDLSSHTDQVIIRR